MPAGVDDTATSGNQPSNPTSNVAATKTGKLGEFIQLDAEKFLEYGSWERLFHLVKGRSNFTTHLDCLTHRAASICHYQSTCSSPIAPVVSPAEGHRHLQREPSFCACL